MSSLDLAEITAVIACSSNDASYGLEGFEIPPSVEAHVRLPLLSALVRIVQT